MKRTLITIIAVLFCATSFAQKDTLRILAIGNSFSQDATEQYLYDIAKAGGQELLIGDLVIGGCSLERHCSNIGKDNTYGYTKIRDGKRTHRAATLLEGITDEKWDIITVQQVSHQAGRPQSYEPYLTKLLDYIKSNAAGNPELFFQQTWAYAKDATHSGFKNYKRDQMTMYDAIIDAVQKATEKHGLKVIPSGTAMQNGRTTVLRENFVRDGFHCSRTCGRYAVACTWFEAITGKSVVGNTYKPEQMQSLQVEICQHAAHAAVQNPWKVTELTDYKSNVKLFNVNTDEKLVPAYTLPDPLKMNDGTPVRNSGEWFEKRRPELLAMFTEEMFGKAPEPMKGIKWEVVEKDTKAFDSLATRKQVKITFPDNIRKGKKKKDGYIMLLVYTPNNPGKHRKAPIFLGINFKGNETVCNDKAIIPSSKESGRFGIYESAKRGADKNAWCVETLLKNGFGLATFYRSDVDPDFDSFDNGIHSLYPASSNKIKPEADEWGSIAAWAWGLSRAMDYLEKDRDVDSDRVAVIGHSRLGKTALWAGATDPRFAMVISNDSGCGGAAISRRHFGENLYAINTVFPYWFCDNFKKYNENEDALPFDQHELLALIAPRPLYVASSSDDAWADPTGEKIALDEAGKVYTFLKAKGKTGYHCKKGKHSITAEDWKHYIKFAKKNLK